MARTASITGATTAGRQSARPPRRWSTSGTLGSATFNIDAYNFLNSQGACANNKADARAIHDSTGAQAPVEHRLDHRPRQCRFLDRRPGREASTCSAACSAPPSSSSSVPRWKPCRTATGCTTCRASKAPTSRRSLQDNSLAQLIRANTGIKHLPGNIFLTPEYTVEASDYFKRRTAASMTIRRPTIANDPIDLAAQPGDRQAAGQRRPPTERFTSSATTTSSATPWCSAAPKATTS